MIGFPPQNVVLDIMRSIYVYVDINICTYIYIHTHQKTTQQASLVAFCSLKSRTPAVSLMPDTKGVLNIFRAQTLRKSEMPLQPSPKRAEGYGHLGQLAWRVLKMVPSNGPQLEWQTQEYLGARSGARLSRRSPERLPESSR